MTEKAERKIQVKYVRSPSYRMIPAGGVFGGVTPHGQLLCNFFVEYQDYPEKSEITVKADGKAGVESLKATLYHMSLLRKATGRHKNKKAARVHREFYSLGSISIFIVIL